MELVRVRIKGSVVSERYGALKSGDIVTTDAAYAKHLVHDCGAGEYMDADRKIKAPESDGYIGVGLASKDDAADKEVIEKTHHKKARGKEKAGESDE